jgi:CRISPR-associated protein (TIGR03985 family)
VDIDKLLEQKIFGCVTSTISNNFDQLSTKRYLQETEEGFKRVAADYFPEALLALDSEGNEISTEYISGSKIGLTTFIERFGKPINSIQRFYLDTDYIVNVDEAEICDVLLSSWSKDPVSLVKFTYKSISEGQNFECVVYPVLFIYPTRAVYLVAFGGNPKAKIAWYNYRIDRIQNITEIKQKDITPEQHKLYDCPDLNPEWAIEQWNSAYGFDFYQEAEEMLLRFDANFYKRYVANTEREIDFEPMHQDRSYGEAKKFLVDRRQHDLLKVLEKCNQKDIYCKVPYRVKDNNVIMRLRAWGSCVEVIYPPNLRKRMADDIFTTWQNYDDKENL